MFELSLTMSENFLIFEISADSNNGNPLFGIPASQPMLVSDFVEMDQNYGTSFCVQPNHIDNVQVQYMEVLNTSGNVGNQEFVIWESTNQQETSYSQSSESAFNQFIVYSSGEGSEEEPSYIQNN